MCVGQKIKKYINDNGISQTHISNKTMIPLPKLNLALNGNRKLTFEEYELICGVLNVNTDKFLEPKIPEEQQSG
ncbi:helix-turn-helix transcriptional regulator [Anaerocolumna sp. AGMB13025]|uniref:helix-turn-helix domain-containing protein n=1 Tax=Anaerocolumna sp. AGMB13025 TaxID=3039116 RepID=UPI00241C98D3|nr:helix-turn-helix transcriptional regulator [Anaerocolumna sp. AGMB13025]WFR56425.1 helix-turn-helix transcriptional regulator [Anaerocolumna sp. AGMB13025]